VGELVDGGGDAEAGDVRLQEALVERVRRDGRLLPLPAARGEAARVRRRRRCRGVHGEPVVRVVECVHTSGAAEFTAGEERRSNDLGGWMMMMGNGLGLVGRLEKKRNRRK
jgi:hypothetical protein